jgi:hypothetical protein
MSALARHVKQLALAGGEPSHFRRIEADQAYGAAARLDRVFVDN